MKAPAIKNKVVSTPSRVASGSKSFTPPSFAERSASFADPAQMDKKDQQQFIDLFGWEIFPDTWEEFLQWAIEGLDRLASNIPGYKAAKAALNKILDAWEFVQQLADLKNEFLERLKEFIDAQIADLEEKAKEKLKEKGIPKDHWAGIWDHNLKPAIQQLRENWWSIIKEGLWEQIWPIPKVWEQIKASLGNLKKAGRGLLTLNFETFFGACTDVWGNINAILGSLSGWISVVVLVGCTITGGPAGLVAGAGALKQAGLAMLASALAEQTTKAALAINYLEPIDQAKEDESIALKNQEYYEDISGAVLFAAIGGSLALLGALGVGLAKGIVKRIKFNGPKIRNGSKDEPFTFMMNKKKKTLTEKQEGLLQRIDSKDYPGKLMTVVGKREVTPSDLASLTLKRNKEFALIINDKGETVLVQMVSYNGGKLPTNTKTLLMHSHPEGGGNEITKWVSKADINTLKTLNQEYSYIVDTNGTIYKFTQHTQPNTLGQVVRKAGYEEHWLGL